MIRPIRTKAQIEKLVEEIITPERADLEARSFCELLQAVTDADGNWEVYELGQQAQRHAFTFTTDFEKAFNKFAGLPTADYNQNEKVSEASGAVN